MKTFHLWNADGLRPIGDAPVGLVKTSYSPYMAFFTPSRPERWVVVAVDEAASTFLTTFKGRELVFGCVRDGIGYRMNQVKDVVSLGKNRFEVTVIDGQPLQPLPDAFEWPRPAPPEPLPLTDEEREEAALADLLRQAELFRSQDPGLAEPGGRHPPARRRSRKRRHTRTAA